MEKHVATVRLLFNDTELPSATGPLMKRMRLGIFFNSSGTVVKNVAIRNYPSPTKHEQVVTGAASDPVPEIVPGGTVQFIADIPNPHDLAQTLVAHFTDFTGGHWEVHEHHTSDTTSTRLDRRRTARCWTRTHTGDYSPRRRSGPRLCRSAVASVVPAVAFGVDTIVDTKEALCSGSLALAGQRRYHRWAKIVATCRQLSRLLSPVGLKRSGQAKRRPIASTNATSRRSPARGVCNS
jgi:hypothetical protein